MNIVINNRITDIEKLLDRGQTLSVMGMPGGGISVLLKELSYSALGTPVYVDVFGLPVLNATELFKRLAEALGTPIDSTNLTELVRHCCAALDTLTCSRGRVVIYFAGFDQLSGNLDGDMLQSLQALVRSNPEARLVFGLCISLKKLIPDEYFDSGLRLFGNRYYIGGYSVAELKYWLKLYGPAGWEKTPDLKKKIVRSGGHLQLLLSLLNEKPEISDTRNESINLLFKNMYQLLLGPQRTIVRSLALGKRAATDEYLSGIGMIKDGELFSPLYARHLSESYQPQLPAKERRLFLLLKKNLGRTVPKQEIIDVVWQGEIASDWALNALVYRLRKHQAFLNKGFTLQNHKKLGYSLSR